VVGSETAPRPFALHFSTSSLPHLSADLESLASADAARLAIVLREVLREVHFDQVNHDLRLPEFGGDYLLRPFPLPGSPVDVANMKARLRHVVKSSENPDDRRLARRIQLAFRFLMFGESVDRKDVGDLVGAHRRPSIEAAIMLGLFVAARSNQVRMNGLSICSRRLPGGDAVYLLADTPPHFITRSGPLRVYAGADSYELMQRISSTESIIGNSVEMGSGSGIQLIAALKEHQTMAKAIGVERDRRARHVSLFNAALNDVADRFAVVADEQALHELLGTESVAFGMSNPPFLALPALLRIDDESRKLLADVPEIRETPDGAWIDVATAFPQAGWGGEDGLYVTRQFIDVLRAVEGPGGRILLYSQFAGDEHGPSLIRGHVERLGDFEFAFDSIEGPDGMRKKSYMANESAETVARLLTAALLEKQEPQRPRLAIRQGGPEHALMQKLAAQIEASYKQAGITHFHDGFVTLVRRA
jgi:hypothetical protein